MAIVGGGIGGVAAANALLQRGLEVRVYEQAAVLTEVGAGLALQPNGVRMLRRLGFGAEVASVLQYQAFDWLDAPIERVGAKFTPLPFAPVMEEWCVPHADDVLAAIYRTLGKNGD